MRSFVVFLLIHLAVAAVSTVVAKCKRYPAYVYDGIVQSCQPAKASDLEDKRARIDEEACQASLKRQPISILTMRVSRLVQVGSCNWERGCVPAVTPWDDVTPTEFRFQLDGECPTSTVQSGRPSRFYAVRPCCDKIPSKSGRCGLRLPVILDPPDWAVDVVNER